MFTVTTNAIADNTVLYWTIVYLGSNAADFSSIGGTVSIVSDTASFTVIVATDRLVENNESFAVQLHVDSLIGTVVATSGMVTITDVPPYIPPVRLVAEVACLRRSTSRV
jgi:hypothetical protein